VGSGKWKVGEVMERKETRRWMVVVVVIIVVVLRVKMGSSSKSLKRERDLFEVREGVRWVVVDATDRDRER
jgi:hypothetical protein